MAHSVEQLEKLSSGVKQRTKEEEASFLKKRSKKLWG